MRRQRAHRARLDRSWSSSSSMRSACATTSACRTFMTAPVLRHQPNGRAARASPGFARRSGERRARTLRLPSPSGPPPRPDRVGEPDRGRSPSTAGGTSRSRAPQEAALTSGVTPTISSSAAASSGLGCALAVDEVEHDRQAHAAAGPSTRRTARPTVRHASGLQSLPPLEETGVSAGTAAISASRSSSRSARTGLRTATDGKAGPPSRASSGTRPPVVHATTAGASSSTGRSSSASGRSRRNVRHTVSGTPRAGAVTRSVSASAPVSSKVTGVAVTVVAVGFPTSRTNSATSSHRALHTAPGRSGQWSGRAEALTQRWLGQLRLSGLAGEAYQFLQPIVGGHDVLSVRAVIVVHCTV